MSENHMSPEDKTSVMMTDDNRESRLLRWSGIEKKKTNKVQYGREKAIWVSLNNKIDHTQ